MVEKPPLRDRIHRASLLAARARVDLDLFAVLTPPDDVDVLEEQWSLFGFIRTAHEHAFLARIVNLLTQRSDTDNFPKLVKEAERVGAIDAATSAAVKAQIKAANSAYERVEIIRHKVVAHQDDTQTKGDCILDVSYATG